MTYSRRDFGRIALAGAPLAAFGAEKPRMINSIVGGVRIGAITYSFNRIAADPEAIIRAMVDIGIGDAELMSEHAEALAGIPAQVNPFAGRGPGAATPRGQAAQGAGGLPQTGQGGAGAPGGGRIARPPLTPEQQAEREKRDQEIRKWRAAANGSTWKAVRKKFNDAGINIGLLCYNMRDAMTDDDIDYGFRMAKALGVKGLTTSTTVSMSKRIAAYADKYKMLVGYHGHDATNNPNEFATLESYAVGMSYGKYNGINLDIGHFTASNYDAVAYIKENHKKITNIHLKDRKKEHGPNVAWGEGDTPMKAVLQLLKKEKYDFPANLELEYRIPQDSDVVTEMKKCFAYVKECLA